MRESQAQRDQEADARPSMGSIDVPCSESSCENSIKGTDIPDSEWQVPRMGDDYPTLCPGCLNRTPDNTMTPSAARMEYNQSLDEFDHD